MSDLRPVIIATSHPNIVPTWEHLSKHYDLCIIGQPGLAMDLGMIGAFPLGKYGNADLNEVSTNIAYEIAGKLHEPKLSASLSGEVERWSGSGVSRQLSASVVRQWFPAMVGEHVKQQGMIINMLKAAMNDRRVVGCVVHEDVTPDMRAIVLYCNSRGVPTIHVPHANCYYTGDGWDIHTECVSRYISASGEYQRDFYAKWGFQRDRIRLTGQPQLDSWYGDNPPTRNESRKVLGVGEQDFVIVYASSWSQLTAIRGEYENEHIRNLKIVGETAKVMKATLVIKMHPGEGQGQEQAYQKFLADGKINGCVMRHYNEYVLRASDVLVAHGPSNICVQAAIVKLPSVYISTEGHEFQFGPVRYNGDMEKAIEQARGKPVVQWDEFVSAMNYVHPHGNAAKNVVEFVREVCQ